MHSCFVGVTSELARRVHEHRKGLAEGFTKRYGVKHLVYDETRNDVGAAIRREKSAKRWRRAWKVELIAAKNPN
jgi:putative endonuclease